MMKRDKELQAGAFVLLSVFLIGLTILTLGREKQVFSSTAAFYTSFTDVKGLKEGAPVRLGGITIGRVSKIGFGEDLKDPSVYVTLEVNERYLSRLKVDSRTSISSQGLLGDRFLSISAGTKAENIRPGGTIGSQNTGDISEILNTAGTVAENVATLSESLNRVLDDFTKDSSTNLKETIQNMREITSAITKGDGLLSELLFSKEQGKTLGNDLSSAVKSLTRIIQQIESGEGVLHQLIFEESDSGLGERITTAASHLSDASSALTEVVTAIRDGDGLLHGLIYGEASSPDKKSSKGLSDLSARLTRILENLEQASNSLTQGTGTLGALLMDPTLYDNLVEVTDDAKRSYFLRSAIRSTLKKE